MALLDAGIMDTIFAALGNVCNGDSTRARIWPGSAIDAFPLPPTVEEMLFLDPLLCPTLLATKRLASSTNNISGAGRKSTALLIIWKTI